MKIPQAIQNFNDALDNPLILILGLMAVIGFNEWLDRHYDYELQQYQAETNGNWNHLMEASK